VRKAKIKVFRNEPPDNILEDVDDTSGLLCDLILEEKDDSKTSISPTDVQITCWSFSVRRTLTSASFRNPGPVT